MEVAGPWRGYGDDGRVVLGFFKVVHEVEFVVVEDGNGCSCG